MPTHRPKHRNIECSDVGYRVVAVQLDKHRKTNTTIDRPSPLLHAETLEFWGYNDQA